jgi:hypothetical protein
MDIADLSYRMGSGSARTAGPAYVDRRALGRADCCDVLVGSYLRGLGNRVRDGRLRWNVLIAKCRDAPHFSSRGPTASSASTCLRIRDAEMGHSSTKAIYRGM